MVVKIYEYPGPMLVCEFEHKNIKYKAVQDWVGTSIAASNNPFHPVYMQRRESRERSRQAVCEAISDFTGMEVSE